jgi:hypothetical protein
MGTNGQIKGMITYLTKLTHTVDSFRFKFVNVEVGEKNRHIIGNVYPQPVFVIKYDLEMTSKEPDIPYLWDFFSCKSKHIMEDGCGMVSIDWSKIFPEIKDIYYNGEKISRYGGNIPDSFIKTVDSQIQQHSTKKIKTHFFCDGKRKELILEVTYELSDIYLDDGIVTDISVYCNRVFVDNEPLENITQDIAETIVGYVSEDENLRMELDVIVWNEIAKYMNLEDCEIWTHTYTYIRNIGDIEIEDFNYINHSTFSSKLCDFITGDY